MDKGNLTFDGQLEIDTDRGVIYFHSTDLVATNLRICGMPKMDREVLFIDITLRDGKAIVGYVKHEI